MKKGTLFFVHAALTSVAFIYGVSYILLKEITPVPFKPFPLVLIRTFGSFIFMWLLCLLLKVNQRIETRRDYFSLFLCGVCGASINQLFFFSGLSRTSSINTGLIVISIPVFVVIISRFWKKEKITLSKAIGILLGMIGSAIIIINSAKSNGNQDDSLGDLFVLANCVLYALYLIIVKPLTAKYPPLVVSKWMFFFGFLINIPLCFTSFTETSWTGISVESILILVYLITIVTAAGYLLNTWALKHVSTAVVSFYVYLQPLFTGIGATLFLNEHFGMLKLTSALLIFIGVYLVNRD